MVVFSIGYQKQRLLGILAAFQLGYTEVYGIVQGRRSLRRNQRQLIAEPPDITCEAFRDSGMGRKFHEEIFVIGSSRLQKSHSRIFGKTEFAFHAVTDVENNPQTHWRRFA